ncbi:unnamed protein product [Chondrus crispus]|uniref:Uncharacterized protein n=1 Tax=Chondrus crispus TaxID=2769 RepID=R7QGP3_CHOCR|nr:unnamed protein product [Chondrus crispus]CDF36923.1 unnamed protein product [Chondrus crispus]|eukprot:XP_005716742.1 unnamed protein product [Chondrus crispus]
MATSLCAGSGKRSSWSREARVVPTAIGAASKPRDASHKRLHRSPSGKDTVSTTSTSWLYRTAGNLESTLAAMTTGRYKGSLLSHQEQKHGLHEL